MASRAIRRFRIFVWALILVVATGGAALYLLGGPPPPVRPALGQGDYQLVTADGAAFNRGTLEGHPSAVFFGFTHCPEVCPTTLSEMTVWFKELGDEAKDLDAYFVTVDPERDTAEVIGQYVAWTGKVVGVTGSRTEIDKAIRSWGVYAEKVEIDGDGYNIDHTASVFLIDRHGEFAGTIGYREDKDEAIVKLRRLMAS